MNVPESVNSSRSQAPSSWTRLSRSPLLYGTTASTSISSVQMASWTRERRRNDRHGWRGGGGKGGVR